MATRRGPKVEPHKNPRTKDFEVVVDKLPEMPQAQVFEEVYKVHIDDDDIEELIETQMIDEVLNEEVLLTEDEIIAEDEFITSEAAKTPHFEFQKDYFFESESYDKQTVIDALPQSQKRKKTIDELNQTELRMFHKTGFMPEI